jgi:hypothetical protein
MPFRAAWLLVFLATLWAAMPVARADLNWEAPESCPELPEMDAALSDVSMHARVETTGSGFEMVLTTGDGATQRISAPTCAELLEALLIIWNLAHVPPSSEAVPSAAPMVEPAGELAIPRVAEETHEAAAEEGTNDPVEVGVALAGALEVGATPQPAPGVALGLSIGASPWRIASTVTLFPPLSYASEFGIEEGIFAIAIDGCGFVFDDVLRIAACGGLETGVAWASAIYVPVRNTAFEPIFAVRAGVELMLLVMEWLGVRVDVFATVPVLRPRFVVRDPDSDRPTVVHQPSEIALRAIAGLEARF